jgi:hypothetical protein
MSHLRHRKDSASTMNETKAVRPGGRVGANDNRTGGLRYEAMMAASPQQTGQVMKLGVSTVFLLLPTFIKQWVLKWRCLAMVRPKWKTRRLILLGRFLYKFYRPVTNDDETDHGHVASRNVGAPVDVLDMEVSLVESAEAERFGIAECLSLLTDGTARPSAVFRVATFRKTYYFACPSKEEALVWIRSLQDARQETIRRSMGHAEVASYSTRWEYFDLLGRQAAATEERIRRRMENDNLRELEMSNLMDSGPLPRGYFG